MEPPISVFLLVFHIYGIFTPKNFRLRRGPAALFQTHRTLIFYFLIPTIFAALTACILKSINSFLLLSFSPPQAEIFDLFGSLYDFLPLEITKFQVNFGFRLKSIYGFFSDDLLIQNLYMDYSIYIYGIKNTGVKAYLGGSL